MSGTSSPLLDKLPAELRNEIWQLVLVLPKQLDLDNDAAVIHQPTSLLKTCRQIRGETSSIFYGENQFFASFAWGQKIHSIPWLDAIDQDNAGHIRHLQLQLGYSKTTGISYSQSAESTTAAFARCIAERGVPPTSVRATKQPSETLWERFLVSWIFENFQKELDHLIEEERS